MKKILIIFGTRPEAIKMAPVILGLKAAGDYQVKVVVTAQHRQMLDQVLELFQIRPDYDLNVMTANQDLFDITVRILENLKAVLQREQPDLILVHGDTSTTFAAALAAYYLKIQVGHVEAGLRTRDKYQPYPEELNRRLTGALADYHFAPTPWARDNLLAEGVPPERIWVTGNTVIDALKIIAAKVAREKELWADYCRENFSLGLDGQRLLLVTGHRRENFGRAFRNICLALRDLAEHYADLHVIYPVHLNPQVQQPVYGILGKAPGVRDGKPGVSSVQVPGGGRITLLPPLDYAPFVFLMSQSTVILTDSGGIQEEAPALAKPVLVMREVTERPEGLWAGTVKLVGTGRKKIFAAVKELLDNPVSYQAMAQAQNPYGDGQAAQRIAHIVKQKFSDGKAENLFIPFGTSVQAGERP
ncbi:MAG: UDP-N-acetylglucosamine 2-epimerase (non-hydrolyzing) [Deltaproteobacteria bacterium]|nr:UDP-N-acetylglucosamine 2-epimerase (non-hydrolyzing) [Deltaproteobacteria bacterium]